MQAVAAAPLQVAQDAWQVAQLVPLSKVPLGQLARHVLPRSRFGGLQAWHWELDGPVQALQAPSQTPQLEPLR